MAGANPVADLADALRPMDWPDNPKTESVGCASSGRMAASARAAPFFTKRISGAPSWFVLLARTTIRNAPGVAAGTTSRHSSAAASERRKPA